MADVFAGAPPPPSGPPPPTNLPEGWKAVYDERYHEWFYVNLYTKKSQWDRPTHPAEPDYAHAPPNSPPPSYAGGTSSANTASALPAETPRVNDSNDRPPAYGDAVPSQAAYPGPPAGPSVQAPYRTQGRRHGKGSRIARGVLEKVLGKDAHAYPGNLYPPRMGVSHSDSAAFRQGHHSYPPPSAGGLSGASALKMLSSRRPGRSGRRGGFGPAALGAGGGLMGGGLLASALGGGHGHHGGGYGGYGGYGHGYGGHGGGYGYDDDGEGYGSGSSSDAGGSSDGGDYDDGGGGDFDGGDFGGDFDGGDFGGGDF
ncbi:MAG: hypothetical protein M1815_003209 [Lichina confinis]|nr:MAG: hypothetical protein M1815_003209 [Lichina confinis]